MACALTVSLSTGLSDNLTFIDWHVRSGFVILGLIAFRLCWGLWGPRHVRFGAYRTSFKAIIRYFTGPAETHSSIHTPPGIVMAWCVWLTCLLQGLTGLATSDDIFTEGPLVRHLDDSLVEIASALHGRVFWLVLGLIAGHLVAIAWYGFARRDPLALAMFTGRKPLAVPFAVGPATGSAAESAGEPPDHRAFSAHALAWLVGLAVVAGLATLP